jgi:hypothetical protein
MITRILDGFIVFDTYIVYVKYIISQKRLENKWISIKGVGIIRAEIGELDITMGKNKN